MEGFRWPSHILYVCCVVTYFILYVCCVVMYFILYVCYVVMYFILYVCCVVMYFLLYFAQEDQRVYQYYNCHNVSNGSYRTVVRQLQNAKSSYRMLRVVIEWQLIDRFSQRRLLRLCNKRVDIVLNFIVKCVVFVFCLHISKYKIHHILCVYQKFSEEVGHAHVHSACFLKIFHVSPQVTIQRSALTGLNGVD